MATRGTLTERDAALHALLRGFEECTVPRELWNHRAHLAYALHLLLEHPGDGGERIRAGILRYNRVQQIEQTLTGGYHETLTRFYIRVVERFVASADRARGLADLTDELYARYGDRELPYRYYSRERLQSWEARTRWVEPDIEELAEVLE